MINEIRKQVIATYIAQGFSEETAAKIASADVVEFDSDGKVIGWGSDRDYDRHGWDVVDGKGYYDDNGHYVAFEFRWEY